MKARQQSSTSYPIAFLMVLTSDHLTGATGVLPVVTLSKNGAAFGAAAGAVTEIGSGWYALAGNATDRNTLGDLCIHVAETGTAALADDTDDKYAIVPYDPFSPNGPAPTVAQVVEGVWSASLSGTHYTAGESGYILGQLIPAPTAAANAAAVWQDLLVSADFGTAGSIGLLLKTDIDAKISSISSGGSDPWLTLLTGTHYTVGMAGYILANSTAPSASAVALAVWQEPLTGTSWTLGQAGYILENGVPVSDKTGFILAATGLDQIPMTQPAASVPTTFREALMWVFRRFFNKVSIDSGALTVTVKKDDSVTTLSTQTYTQTSTNQTQNRGT